MWVCCLLFLTGCERKPAMSNRAGPQAFTVDTLEIRTQPFHEALFATGNLLANESVLLKAERAGTIKEIRFKEGQPVKAGELLLAIDDSELQAQAASAQARLELARAVEKRDYALFDTKMLSAAEYDQSQANLHVAEAELQLIRAQIDKSRVVAPFDGIIGLRQVSPGAYLIAGSPIASLQDIASLKLDFTVPERYLPLLRVGQTATFHVAGNPETFTATIKAIEPAISTETRSLQVRATAPNPDKRLLPGAFAEINLLLEEDPNAILIPPIALIPGLKKQLVYVHHGGAVEQRQVQVGLRTADAVQILSGLKPGDRLVTSGILQLRPGMKVAAKEPAKPSAVPASPDSSGTTTSPDGGTR